MNKLFEAVDTIFSSSDDIFLQNYEGKFFYITKEEYFNDIKSFELGFANGESVFIPDKYVIDYFFQITQLIDIVDDPVINNGFKFERGCIKIDSSLLTNMLGDDFTDDFIKKPELNNIKVEFNNNYSIHSDIPFIILLPSQNDDTGIVRIYSNEDNAFIIDWNYKKLM